MSPDAGARRPGRTSPRAEPSLELVYGLHPVMEALEQRRREIERIWVARERVRSLGRLLRLARRAGIPVTHVPREILARKVGRDAAHQGLAAVVAPVPYADVEELCRDAAAVEDALLVLVDRVEDAGNLGAILRTSVAAGVRGVILSSEGTAGLGSEAAKASAGALDRIPVAREPQPAKRIRQLGELGFRTVVLDPHGERLWSETPLAGRLLVVAGGERRGARPGVVEACRERVRIPLAGGLDSLNVAVALGVLLFEAVRQRRRPSLASPGPCC